MILILYISYPTKDIVDFIIANQEDLKDQMGEMNTSVHRANGMMI